MLTDLYYGLFIVGGVLLVLFGFVIVFGAPFLPTLRKQIDTAFKLMNLKPGQHLLELGSGDGRILKEAAKRKIYSVGYELNPLLVIYSWVYTYKYRKYIKIVWGNYWRKSWPQSDAIFVFLLDPYMEKLNKEITQRFSNPITLVSFAFKIPSKEVSSEKNGMYVYKYNKK